MGSGLLLLAGVAWYVDSMARKMFVPISRSVATSLCGSWGGRPDINHVISSVWWFTCGSLNVMCGVRFGVVSLL